MAQAYRCRVCGWTITVGVPTVALTRQVSEILSREFGRMIVYHDWSPASTDKALREGAEKIWEEKCEEYFKATKSLHDVPAMCPSCAATHSWDIALGADK